MTTKKKDPKDTQFKKGNTASAVKRGPKRTRSKLRDTLESLQEMEVAALKTIEQSLKASKVDKEALNTAKWLLTTIVTFNRAAIADEQLSFNVRVQRDEFRRQQQEDLRREGTSGNVIRFSTRMPDDEEDD